MNRIAFVQGRLVDEVNKKIQAFPRDSWELELKKASKNNIKYIELTVDLERVWENPIASNIGQSYLKEKLLEENIKPIACTADFIMHSPPWKGDKKKLHNIKSITEEIIHGLSKIDCNIIVIPFVDESSLKNKDYNKGIDFLLSLSKTLKESKVRVAIESDFEPDILRGFIDLLPHDLFGINYDIGNSASLGFNYIEEFEAYFERIIHIHVKDRLLYGTTVPLGEGNADINGCFKAIKEHGYQGDFSMQTARDPMGNHIEAMLRYIRLVEELLSK